MAAFSLLVVWLGGRFPLVRALAGGRPYAFLLSVAVPTATDPNATNIKTFFSNLITDVLVFALTMAGFFFALSALFYMSSGVTGNERARQHAISSLYAALGGLALALLATTFAGLVNTAAGGH